MTKIRLLIAASSLVATLIPAKAAGTVEPTRKTCVPAVATASPIGTTGCPGVRPGALIEIPSQEAFCTLGFLYRNSKKQYFMTTAGHCAIRDDNNETKVWAPGKGPVVLSGSGKTIGRFVFARYESTELEGTPYDIGVIQISSSIKPSAQVCHFGGPTAMTTSRSTSAIQLQLYGNALGVGDAFPARTLMALGMPDPYHVSAVGPSSLGDSGGPVLTNGKAVGFVYAIGLAYDLRVPTAPNAGHVFVQRLGPQINAATSALRFSLSLQTAKTL